MFSAARKRYMPRRCSVWFGAARSRSSIEGGRIDALEAAADRVIVQVHGHRLLPPVAIESNLMVEAVRAFLGSRGPPIRHDPRAIHPHLDHPVVARGIPDVIYHVVPAPELNVRQRMALADSRDAGRPDRQRMLAAAESLADERAPLDVALLARRDNQTVVDDGEPRRKQERKAVPNVLAQERIVPRIEPGALNPLEG